MAASPARNAEPRLDEFLCFAVYTANLSFNRIYEPLLQALDLTYLQYLVLVALWAEDNQIVGSLGEKLHLKSNTLTPLLKRLEAAGHVERRRDPDDERQVRIRLTAQGRALQERARQIPSGVLKASGMTPEDLRGLQGEITRLRDRLLASGG
jgi:DNA-binding MarR family transcriptional regulator